MSDGRELAERERRAAEQVGQLPAAHPEPSYRARIRRDFIAGSLAPPRSSLEQAPARSFWDSMLLPAAAGILVLAGLLLNQGPGWEILEMRGEGTALVNGRALAMSDQADLARALRDGARLQISAGASMTLTAPGLMAVEVTPGTEAVLSPPPARWLGRIASAEVANGELRFSTGGRFHGSHLMVKTPEARVEVTGTTLAVIRDTAGTCVCVMDGVVRVGVPGQPMVSVPAGRRRYVHSDGREPELDEMLPVERIKLGEMMARHPAGAR